MGTINWQIIIGVAYIGVLGLMRYVGNFFVESDDGADEWIPQYGTCE